jgi:hypothetical protein
MFAANHLGLRNGCLGTVIGERGMQSCDSSSDAAALSEALGGLPLAHDAASSPADRASP